MAKADDKDEALKRLGGGRWQTRDGRFAIEPQSGTWVVVDAEQTDDLGLPLVRGPYGSLRDAKEAIDKARGSEPAASPLSAKVEELRSRPAAAKPSKAAKPAKPAEPEEPRWLTALEPDQRRRARQLVQRLEDIEAPDPEGIVRRDVVGNVPSTAAYAIERAVLALKPDASPADVARLLADGRDEGLGVRWRLVDGDDRPILLKLDRIVRRV
jgi:pyruvate/2-oxoglutarate dehydrogenase complex dihydrolipoamide acyltransferase (E2) component